jgi:hypothetical protein
MVLYCVKGLLKIKFENDNLPLRRMANVRVLKCPSKAILNRSIFNEPILVILNQVGNDLLNSICQ